MRRILAALGLAAALAGQAQAEPSAGEQALTAKNYSGAYLLLRQEANEGSARAQFLLGTMSDNGFRPIALDPAEAVRWYRLAAEAGHAEAQFRLAAAYAIGRGVKQDRAEALLWLERAGENKYGPALLALAGIYQEGRGGVPADAAQATRFLRRAAELGDATAQMQYADWLREGRDPEAALTWYRRAAEQGNATAQLRLAQSLATPGASDADVEKAVFWATLAGQASDQAVKDEAAQIRRDMSSRLPLYRLAEAERDARAWKPKPAPAGNSSCTRTVQC